MDYFYILLSLNNRHQKMEKTGYSKRSMNIPKKKNGEEYKLKDLNEGQIKIACVILK